MDMECALRNARQGWGREGSEFRVQRTCVEEDETQVGPGGGVMGAESHGLSIEHLTLPKPLHRGRLDD